MRRILIPAAVGVLSLALANPAHAQRGGGGGGRPGGGGAHAGAAHVGAAHVGGAHVGGAGAYHGAYHAGAYHGGNYYHNNHYHYPYYPGLGIGLGIGYGIGYGSSYDPTPIYVPSTYPTVGPLNYSYYPSDSGVLGSQVPSTTIAPPPVTPPAPISVPADEAYVRVLVPDGNAEVLLEGKQTDGLGRDRLFSSPKLDPGSKYSYTVTASWLDQGRLVRLTREVPLTAGQTSVVDFRRPQRTE